MSELEWIGGEKSVPVSRAGKLIQGTLFLSTVNWKRRRFIQYQLDQA